MKAVSFRQPWAFAVLHLGKRVENRVRASHSVRALLERPGEEFLIHASATVPRSYFNDACEAIRELVGDAAWDAAMMSSDLSVVASRDLHGIWVPGDGMPMGGVVGMAMTTGVFLPPNGDAFMRRSNGSDVPAPRSGNEQLRKWHMREQFGYVIEGVEPLDFYPCKGTLGVFEVAGPDGVYDEDVEDVE